MYVFIRCNVCTTPSLPYSPSLLHPFQSIKYPSVVSINIHPGSSIRSQFWFCLLSVIRPQALCGVALCILAEKDTLKGDLWFGRPVLERTMSVGANNLPLSDLTHTLHCDGVCRQDAARTRAWPRLLPESLELRIQCNYQKCHRISSGR